MLADPKDTSRLTDVTLSMDDPQDQAHLAELMAQGNVRSIHSQEATLEEVFIEVAGIRPA
jgi:ABC-2 type transport system ATP-binding protein